MSKPTALRVIAALPLVDAVVAACGAERLHLVGGAVRDVLIGEAPTDLDFICDHPTRCARRVSEAVGGKPITLHEVLPATRVVTRHGGARCYLDFVARRAPGLRDDLRLRDFTVNAIAVGPIGGRALIQDPTGGRADLAARLVRRASPASLTADPVRVVRAYRLVSRLGFSIEEGTRADCARCAGLLADVAAGRVGAEVTALAAGEHFGRAFRLMADDGVLAGAIPEFAALIGVEQGGIHEFDVAGHSLMCVARLGDVIAGAADLFPAHSEQTAAYLADTDNRVGLVLAALLHDLGKPECRVPGEGRWRFFGHEGRGAELADAATRRLRLPKRIRRQISLLVGSHMRLLPFMSTDEPTERARRRLVRQLAPHHIGLVLLALADRMALRSEPLLGDEEAVHRRMAALFAAARELEAGGEPAVPITGADLVSLGLEPGPLFAEILEAAEEEWVSGGAADKQALLDWVRGRWAE